VSAQSTSPEAQAAALLQLAATEGFKLVCEKFSRDRDALRNEAMDCEDDVKAAKLRAAWKKLREFDPEKLRTVVIYRLS